MAKTQFRTGQIGTGGDAWAAFTPTITAGSGTFTTTSSSMRFQQIGKTCYFSGSITITTVGTGVGVQFTLPATAANTNGILCWGREDQTTGKMVVGKFGSTTLGSLQFYDNTTTGGTGHVYRINGFYEVA